MMRVLLCALVLLAACSGAGSTGPKPLAGVDPTVLFVNRLPAVNPRNAAVSDTAVLTWVAKSGRSSVTIIPPGATVCAHFLAESPTDSVQFTMYVGDSTVRIWKWEQSYWFPATPDFSVSASEFWTDTLVWEMPSGTIQGVLQALRTAPC